jgi:hypothetical protein
MTFYSFVYTLCYVGFRLFWLQHTIQGFLDGSAEPRKIVSIIVGGLSMVAIVGSGMFGVYHFGVACRNLVKGQTAVERYKGKPLVFENNTCLENFEEVCGTRSLFVCWLFPFFVCFEPHSDGFYTNRDGIVTDQSPHNHVPTYT